MGKEKKIRGEKISIRKMSKTLLVLIICILPSLSLESHPASFAVTEWKKN